MINHWLGWALLSAAFAALTALLSKAGLRNAAPDAAQLIRTATVLAAVLALTSATGDWRKAATFSGHVWAFLILAGIATAASWVCYYRALAVGDAARVAAVDKLSVVMIGVAAAFGFDERLSPLGWLGVGLTAAGAMMVSLSR